MNNACKYSRCNQISISLSREGRFIHLSIKDNGKGFNYESTTEPNKNNSSLGLVSMKERAETSDGSFELHSSKSEGTTILCKWAYLQKKA